MDRRFDLVDGRFEVVDRRFGETQALVREGREVWLEAARVQQQSRRRRSAG